MRSGKIIFLFAALLICLSGFSPLTVLAEDTPPFDGLQSDPRAMLLADPAPLVEADALNRTPNRAAAACTVPSDSYATIAEAVADPNCDPILISAGTYTENLVIERPVTIHGAGAISTTVDGRRRQRGLRDHQHRSRDPDRYDDSERRWSPGVHGE